MTIYAFRTSTYARNIYLYGTTTLDAIPADYKVPTEQYAAANYTSVQIQNALTQNWITQQEYQDTISYVPAP